MKTLGVLGGMSWESTAIYYRLLNQGVAARLGGLHSAALLLHSVDFAPLAAQQAAGDWDAAFTTLEHAARGLAAAGAQGLLLATNTMHKGAERIAAAFAAGGAAPASIAPSGALPLLHIADATGAALQAAGVQHAALLGTRFTMEDDAIVRGRLQQRFGLRVSVPGAEGRATMHRIVYDELCRGQVLATSRRAVVGMIGALQQQGAQAVVLGCTEIGMLVDDACSPLPTFDTTALHAAAAVAWMLEP
jgi:aspartate racemase